MSDVLSTKIAELVAIGASIAANCQPCLKYHFDTAKKAGATDAEISAAIDIGQMVKAKPAEHIRKLANKLVWGKAAEELPKINEVPLNTKQENVSGCGCQASGGG